MVAGRIVLALSCAVAGFLSRDWAFVALFFVQGAAGSAIMVGAQTMNIELCPYDKRSTYLAVMALFNVPAVFFLSFIGAWVVGRKIDSALQNSHARPVN
jgi:MFS family permease